MNNNVHEVIDYWNVRTTHRLVIHRDTRHPHDGLIVVQWAGVSGNAIDLDPRDVSSQHVAQLLQAQIWQRPHPAARHVGNSRATSLSRRRYGVPGTPLPESPTIMDVDASLDESARFYAAYSMLA
jgi:hypothetical protein